MPKFKVGDRVELISKKPKWGFGYARTGSVGVVCDVYTESSFDLKINFPKHKGWLGMASEFALASATKSTEKPKEPKTMTATKKPGTSHGKPTAKGLRVEKKPTAAKVSKYPAPRVQIAALVPVKPLDKMTKLELIETYYALRDQFDNQAADHCIAGTKLDRALVDLEEAKKRIKELSKELEAAK
jgi:hypothetical protein